MTRTPFALALWLPFIIVRTILGLWLTLPFLLKVLSILALAGVVVYNTLSEAGPFRVASLARRFSWLGVLVSTILVWWLYCALLIRFSGLNSWSVALSGIFLLSEFYAVWFFFVVIRRGHLDGANLRRGYRRIRLRLRWDSVAKSCGLSHTRDIRPANWTTGGTKTNILGATRVQWTATLWHGRRGNGDTTIYRVRPARGSGIESIRVCLDGMAIAVDAYSAILGEPLEGFLRTNWWELTVMWSDPTAEPLPLSFGQAA